MINVSGDKRKFHRSVDRIQTSFEIRYAKPIRKILSQQINLIADSIAAGDFYISDTLLEHTAPLINQYKNIYLNIGSFWFEDNSKRIRGEKGLKNGMMTKDANGIFFQSFEQWVSEYALQKVVTIINPATINMFRIIIDQGVREGLSTQQISAKIRQAEPFLGSYRARRISATETHTAMTKAVDDTMNAYSLFVEKDWNAFRDERTRISHDIADGQIRDKKDPFDVGGESLMYPGDPNGSAENVIFCRCIATYNTIRTQKHIHL